MDYQLVIVKGRSASKAIPLTDGVTTVGRHDDCQLRIKSSQVSRRHCEIFEKKGLLLVKDLGSSNGTFVNGKKVEGQRVLEPGDEITIGSVTLQVVKIAAPAPAPASAAPASKPGDTAIVAAMGAGAVAPAESGDEFDIEFEDGETDLEVANVAPKAPVAPPPKPAPKPTAKPESSGADEAIADFLLGIKLEDEE